MGDTTPVPDDWEGDCDDCRWILEHYDREDLYLFPGTLWLEGLHANPVVGAKMKEVGHG